MWDSSEQTSRHLRPDFKNASLSCALSVSLGIRRLSAGLGLSFGEGEDSPFPMSASPRASLRTERSGSPDPWKQDSAEVNKRSGRDGRLQSRGPSDVHLAAVDQGLNLCPLHWQADS